METRKGSTAVDNGSTLEPQPLSQTAGTSRGIAALTRTLAG